MKTGEKELKKIKEANLFIRAKQRLSEAELKLWAYQFHKRNFFKIGIGGKNVFEIS